MRIALLVLLLCACAPWHHSLVVHCVDTPSAFDPVVDTTFLSHTVLVQAIWDPPPHLQYDPSTAALSEAFTEFDRFRFLLLASSHSVVGTTATWTTSARPLTLDDSIQDSVCPLSSPCEILERPVQVNVFASRPIVQYTLRPVEQRLPFGYVQLDHQGAAPPPPCAANTTANCEPSSYRVPREHCNEVYVQQTFFDTNGTVDDVVGSAGQLNASCGATRDVDLGMLDNSCLDFCCKPCNTTGRTDYRAKRVYAVGPMCRAYEITAGTVDVDLLVGVRIGDNVLTEPLVYTNARPTPPDMRFAHFRTDGPQMPSTTNENRTLRVTFERIVSISNQPLLPTGSYVLLCDYLESPTNATTNGPTSQGPFNPYVSVSLVNATKHPSESPAFAEVPYDDALGGAQFLVDVGAGLLPTRSLLGGDVSWFHISADHYEYLSERTQPDIVDHWRSRVDELCHPTNNTLLDDNYYVPGLDSSLGANVTHYPTPCQMSARMNAYAAQFNSTLVASAGNVSAAYAAADALYGGPPLGIAPGFLLERPNMWTWIDPLGGAKLMHDPLADREALAAFELAVDVPAHLMPRSDDYPRVHQASHLQCSRYLDTADDGGVDALVSVSFTVQITPSALESVDDAQRRDSFVSCDRQAIDVVCVMPGTNSAEFRQRAEVLYNHTTTDHGDAFCTAVVGISAHYSHSLNDSSSASCRIEVLPLDADSTGEHSVLASWTTECVDVLSDSDSPSSSAPSTAGGADDLHLIEDDGKDSHVLAWTIVGSVSIGLALICIVLAVVAVMKFVK